VRRAPTGKAATCFSSFPSITRLTTNPLTAESITAVAPTAVLDLFLRWAGQYLDSTTGLYDLRARYYDPTTGQFISRDPLEGQTGQPYEYGGDNPMNETDPSGLDGVFGTGIGPNISFNDIVTRDAGFWDGLTSPIFGGTAALRDDLGLNGGLDECSSQYQIGHTVGQVTAGVEAGTATGGALEATPLAELLGPALKVPYFGIASGEVGNVVASGGHPSLLSVSSSAVLARRVGWARRRGDERVLRKPSCGAHIGRRCSGVRSWGNGCHPGMAAPDRQLMRMQLT
jgi:RHS repeat-associated protein